MFFFYGFVDFSQHALDFIFIGRSLFFFTACRQIKWSLICSILEVLYEAWICCFFFVFSLAIGQKSYELITHAL